MNFNNSEGKELNQQQHVQTIISTTQLRKFVKSRDKTVSKKDRKNYLKLSTLSLNKNTKSSYFGMKENTFINLEINKDNLIQVPTFPLKEGLNSIQNKSQQSSEKKQQKLDQQSTEEIQNQESQIKQNQKNSLIENKDNSLESNILQKSQLDWQISQYESQNNNSFNSLQIGIDQIDSYQASKTEEEGIKLIQLIEETFKNDNEKLLKYQESSSLIFWSLKQKNYYLTKYLTSGGEGDIFFGYQERVEYEKNNIKEYVFKIYLDIQLDDIIEEINIMESFGDNINIIKLQDEIKVDNNVYILVLEKCQYSLKDELKEILRFQKEFSPQQLFQIIFDLLDGLIQLRIYKTLHLDIKPANILKTKNGNYVFTDFGCSSKVKKDELIQQKGFTVKYASYEQLNNKTDKIYYQSDVQSLGKTLKEVFNVFKIVNQKINSYDFIIQILENRMDKNNIQEREELKIIHSLFFQLMKNDQFQFLSFLQSYEIKIEKIKNLFTFDDKKDIQYFQQIKLYYAKLHFDILKQIYILIDSKANKTSTNEMPQSNEEKHINLFQVQFHLTFRNLSDQQIEKINYFLSFGSSMKFLSECYKSVGDSQNALKYALETLEMNIQFYGRNHYLIPISLQFIGYCYTDLGDPQFALQYAKESLEMEQQFQEGNCQQISSSLYFLGQCYSNLGDSQNAMKYAKESLEMKKQIYSGNHPSISSSLEFLGQCYKDLGDSQNALKYAKESHEMYKQLYSGNHPSISISLYFLGQCYSDLGDSQNALKYAKESLEMKQQLYEGNHPLTSSSLFFLGQCYFDLGDSQNALMYAKESLEMDKQLYKGNHPSISFSLQLIGQCKFQLGDQQKALKYAIKSLEMNQQLYSGNHKSISASLYFLGQCFKDLGDLQNALKYAKESLQMNKQLYSEIHPSISYSLYLLGQCYSELGDSQNALKYAQESLEMFKQLYSGNHPSISSSLQFLGQCYKDLGDSQNALKYAQESLEMKKQLYQGNHPSISSTLKTLGECYIHLGDLQNALEYAKLSLEMEKQLYSGNRPSILIALVFLGRCYLKIGDSINAFMYAIESFTMAQSLYSGNHPVMLASMIFLGSCFYKQGDIQNALKYAKESYLMGQQLYSGNCPQISSIIYLLALCYREIGDLQNALIYAKQSYEISLNFNNHQSISSSLKLLGQCMKDLEHQQIFINKIFSPSPQNKN